ncbi:DUF72 domain-containing protein [Actinomarinicola tropica]|uniref:DUF72 domain-containing protein n=1 Tax=Actinomarinicola tropica TaxID=2789776 RepID=UPI001E5D0DE9|nr:DUF72 domain-containing protein [Actinomarinicola tropica]
MKRRPTIPPGFAPYDVGKGRVVRSATIRVGTSGWDYADWRGVVYPEGLPKRRWFEHYTSLFDTVELNATFYRLPAPETVARWAAQAPEGFTYAVKVGQFGTHRKKLKDPAGWLARHLERVDVLGPSEGPNLIQLPPRWRRNLERLDELLTVAPRSHGWAVELRDPSWVHDDTFDLLARHGAALCLHDLLVDHPWERTADWTYLRFHGPDALAEPYQGAYGRRRLGHVAERLEPWIADGVDVWAYFNNDWDGHAVADATCLRDLLGAAPVVRDTAGSG